MNQIHTDALLKSIDNLGANPVLGTRPPLIDRSEQSPPRRNFALDIHPTFDLTNIVSALSLMQFARSASSAAIHLAI